MSLKAMVAAWQAPVKANLKLVLLALADHANDDGECWPGLKGIARKCGVTERAVIKYINELTKNGLVFKRAQFDKSGRQRTNIYSLNMTNLGVNTVHPRVNAVQGEGEHCSGGRVNIVHPNLHIESTIESETTNVVSCSEQNKFARKPEAKPVISLLLNTGEEYPLCQIKLDEFQELYASVDVLQEFKKIKAWCINNPKKRKTEKGVLRFVNSWLAKEQDKPRFNHQSYKSSNQVNNFAGAI